jgi:hypothetical protein
MWRRFQWLNTLVGVVVILTCSIRVDFDIPSYCFLSHVAFTCSIACGLGFDRLTSSLQMSLLGLSSGVGCFLVCPTEGRDKKQDL